MSEESAVVPAAVVVPPAPEEPAAVAAVEVATPAAQNGGGPPRRVKLTEQQLEAASKEELVTNWKEQDAFLDTLDTQAAAHEAEITSLREALERMKQQHAESQHREKVLVRRLASKEQEMQDYASQLAELRAAQVPSAAALRSALLDPAASLLVQKLRQELAATKTRLEETQNELSAWKFTPDSNTGKRLMAKCRLLYQENEELGRVISSGRLAKLEGELALQKSFSDEVKKSQSELDEFLQELDEDVEGMQGTIYFLQQQLKTAKESVVTLTQENAALRQASGAVHAETGDESSAAKEVTEKSWGEEEEETTSQGEDTSCPPAEEEREGEEEEPMETDEQPAQAEEQAAAAEADKEATPSSTVAAKPPSPLSDEGSNDTDPPESKKAKVSPATSPAQEAEDESTN